MDNFVRLMVVTLLAAMFFWRASTLNDAGHLYLLYNTLGVTGVALGVTLIVLMVAKSVFNR